MRGFRRRVGSSVRIEMAMRTLARLRPWSVFALGAITIALAWVALIRQGLAARHPDIAAIGTALDLVVTMPLVYYLVIVRQGLARAVTIFPVAAVGLLVARAIVPGSPKALIALGALAELVIIVAALIRVRSVIAAARARGEAAADPFDTVESFVRGILPVRAVADSVIYELGVIDWALFRRGRRARRGFEDAFLWSAASEWVVVVVAFSIVIVAESLALHVWLSSKFPSAAWIVTLLDLYAIVWLVADVRALGANGVRLTDEGLSIRFGIRWAADLPIDKVERVERAAGGNWDRKLALIEDPTLVIVMREPVTLRGPYGIRRQAMRLGIRVDDSAALERRLSERIGADAAGSQLQPR